jgi:hypothetical protein
MNPSSVPVCFPHGLPATDIRRVGLLNRFSVARQRSEMLDQFLKPIEPIARGMTVKKSLSGGVFLFGRGLSAHFEDEGG